MRITEIVNEAVPQGTVGLDGKRHSSREKKMNEPPAWFDDAAENKVNADRMKPGDKFEIMVNNEPVDVEFNRRLSQDTIQVKPNVDLSSQDIPIDAIQLSPEYLNSVDNLGNIEEEKSKAAHGKTDYQRKRDAYFKKKDFHNKMRGYDLDRRLERLKHKDFGKYLRMKFMQGYDEMNRLMSISEDDIEETASGGATSAGGIAMSPGPNIVGDTAHTPSDNLRHKINRRKHYEKRKEEKRKDD